jgi:hypothetical protein
MKLLIIGSNFGKYHLNAATNSKKFKEIFIVSPNIFKKKNYSNVKKYKNYKDVLKLKKIEAITIATKPNIQDQVLKYIYKKKYFPKFMILEKPILFKSIKILKKYPKNCKFLTNFIYLFNNQWISYKKKISFINKISNIDYRWYFKQAYFVNKKKTWKVNRNDGGGLINYYLPHVISNLLSIFKNVRFISIENKKFYQAILVFVDLLFLYKKNYFRVKIYSRSNFNIHKLVIKYNFDKKNCIIINRTKKWLSNFNIYYNNKVYLKKRKLKNRINDGRYKALFNLYSNFKYYFSQKNIAINQKLTYDTFKIINLINKKL